MVGPRGAKIIALPGPLARQTISRGHSTMPGVVEALLFREPVLVAKVHREARVHKHGDTI
eukprot:9402687-Pyramimonas_sp.AAC.1